MIDSILVGHGIAIFVVNLIKNILHHRPPMILIHSPFNLALPPNLKNLFPNSKILPLPLMQILKNLIFNPNRLIKQILIIDVGGC